MLLWGGGIWRWLDALTPIRAVERLAAEGRRVHLFFLGVGRPAPTARDIPSSAGEAIAYARERGLEGRYVHFNHGWVPYEERQSYLLEADLGISAHHEHLEARFSFRTRVLDYLWAGLPMVLTQGRLDGRAGRAARASAPPSTPRTTPASRAACAELLDDADRQRRHGRRVPRGAPSRSAGRRRRARSSTSASTIASGPPATSAGPRSPWPPTASSPRSWPTPCARTARSAWRAASDARRSGRGLRHGA